MVSSTCSRSVFVSTPRSNENRGLRNVTWTEKPSGTLELFLGSSSLTVQVVCADITYETTDLIMHVITQDFSIKGGVAKALIRAGGKIFLQECQKLGKPPLFTTQYTKAGNLAVGQIAHVIAPESNKIAELQRCLTTFFDDVVTRRNICSISFSAVGASAMGFSETQSADLIFDNVSRISKSKNSSLKLVRIVIFEKTKFRRFKDASKAFFASTSSTTSSNLQSNHSSYSSIAASLILGSPLSKKPESTTKEGMSIRIYSDGRNKIDKAWEELKKKMNENIQEKIMTDNVIKKFTVRDLDKLRKLERDFDFEIRVDQGRGDVQFKGHILDIAHVQGEISEILNDIKENKSKGKINVVILC